MIKVVQLSSNPVSGSPWELYSLLKNSSKIECRLIQGTSEYVAIENIPSRSFPYDLLWNENKEECLELIKNADIIHIHNSLFPENLKEYINPNQVIILHLYSVYRDKLQPFIDECSKLNPLIIIADQPWQKKVYEDLSQIYLPLVKTDYCNNTKKEIPSIVYAPTNKLPLSHIYSKGYYEVLEILARLKQKYIFDLKIIESVLYKENLQQKHNIDILIDDVINEDAMHGSSLEACCYGAIPLTNYTGDDYPFKKTNLQNLEKTLENYLLNASLLESDKQKITEWQKQNYNVDILLNKYEIFYEKCLDDKKNKIPNIENPHEQSERMEMAKTKIYQIMVDWLNKNNIPFFLSFGSALKAYRDNEHALDADFGVMYEHKWKVKKAIETNLPEEIIVNCIWRGEITFRFKDSKYPKLDIIFFDRQNDYYRCNIYSRNPINKLITWERGIRISHEALDKFKQIEFKGRLVNIPKNIKKYLEENYTDEWKIPIPNKSMGWGSRPCADYDHRQVAIIIPTFIREDKVTECITSILKTYPEGMVRIYVGDQSDEISEQMQEFYKKLQSKGHVFVRLPFNCGLSYARNYLIKQTKSEPYIMIIDDDFIFTEKTDLSKFIDVLEEQEFNGIAGGCIDKRYHYAGWLDYLPSINKILKINIFSVPQAINLTTEYNYKQRKVAYYYSDIVLNFFLAKKEIFNDIEWDNDLILVEHTDFMLRLKQLNKWKVCYVPEVSIDHSPHINEDKYKNFRHNENKNIGIERFCKKWNLSSLNDIWKLSDKITVQPQEDIGLLKELEAKEDKQIIEVLPEKMETKSEEIAVETETIKKEPIDNTNSINVFRELTEILDKENVNFCLMKTTCLNVVLNRKFTDNNHILYMSIYMSDKLKEILKSMNYLINDGKITKNNITIYLLPMPARTKKWTVGNKVMNVPYPLVKYLENTFHQSWEKITHGK
jgi:GT2 family glycosyltransferase